MSETTRTAEATPKGASNAPGSLDAAASAFQAKLFPQPGTKRKPGESSPKAQGAPPAEEVEETDEVVEPEVDEVEETDESEEQPEPEVTDETDETTDEGEVEVTDESESEDEVTEDVEDDETKPTVKSRKLKFSDGTEEEVSEDEAYNGYLRTKDYTRKTQQAAEARKKAEAAERLASERAAEHAAQLEQVKAAMDRMVPKEPNWAELRKKLSPEDFAAAVSDWQAFKSERDAVEAAQAKVAKERAEQFAKDYESWRRQEVDLLMAGIPEWVDPKVGQKEAGEMAAYAQTVGFSKEEVDNAVDHRYLLLIRKAMLWDRAQKSAGKITPKVTKGGIKNAPPGGKKPAPKPKSDEQRARESLRQSGSIADAAAVFSQKLNRGRRPA